MPLEYHKHSKEFQLGIWQMNESIDELNQRVSLSASDQATLAGFKSDYRKQEWLTTRVLVKQLLSTSEEISITYNSNGKPQLVNSQYSISISHTKNFVAVLLSEKEHIGIDLETIQPRIEKISKKFITPEEEKFIEPDKKLIYQHVFWGTKEVLFKIYSKGELNFLENLKVRKFSFAEKGELKAEVIKENFRKEIHVFYEKWNDLMLVYSTGD
jgi:4'-phosphopantetheinyl transferase